MNSTDRIVTIIGDINRYHHDYVILSHNGIPTPSECARYHGLSMVLFTMLNLIFELGEEILVMDNAGIPHSYRDIFSRLFTIGAITEAMKCDLTNLVYYRNRLVHQYTGMDTSDLVAISEKMEVICDFVKIMKEHITSHRA